jgi:hypothetical protein
MPHRTPRVRPHESTDCERRSTSSTEAFRERLPNVTYPIERKGFGAPALKSDELRTLLRSK